MKVGPSLIQGPRLSIDPAEPAQKQRFLFSHNAIMLPKYLKKKFHTYMVYMEIIFKSFDLKDREARRLVGPREIQIKL